MALKKLSKQEFLDELNRNLKDHPGYEDWMQFVSPPEGVETDTVEGFERAGPEPRHSLYAVSYTHLTLPTILLV